MKSIWEKDNILKSFDMVKNDKKTDVLIIGGGMAGLLCGYFFGQQGIDYLVAEQGRIASGITKNTTAKITSQHGLIYSRLLKKIGRHQAELYYRVNEEALSKYRQIASQIDCDFEEKDAFVYSVDDKEQILAEAEAVGEIGGRADFVQETGLPFQIEGAVRFRNQAQFHPLKFISGIVGGMRIYENSCIEEIKKIRNGYSAIVKNALGEMHRINAEKVIVATHFPFLDRHGMYFMKMYQKRSYVLALDGAPDVGGMYISDKENGLSFRNYDGCLLLGGCGSRTGAACGGLDRLAEYADAYYPKAQISGRWAAQDCMTLDQIPYIGQYAKHTENLMVASGFNKWGMTSSMAAAQILTGQADAEAVDFFRPDRSMMKPQLLINGFETTKSMIKPVRPRCSHLKCALKWNRAEKSWDCPCHGSRFDEEGRVIDNPAQRAIKG